MHSLCFYFIVNTVEVALSMNNSVSMLLKKDKEKGIF